MKRVHLAILLVLGLILVLLLMKISAHAAPRLAPLLSADIAVSSVITTPGSTLTYTATVTNAQGFDADAEVQLPVPAHVSYTNNLAHWPTTGSVGYHQALNRVIWAGTIPAGGTLNIRYDGVADNPLRDGTIITGVVEVNDHFNPVYGDEVTTVVHSEPDLSPSWKQSVPGTVTTEGQIVTTTLHIENIGTTDAHVYVTETVPVCLSLGSVQALGIIVGPDSIYWDFDLAAGEVHTLTYQATAQGGACFNQLVQPVSTVNDSYHPEFTLTSDIQLDGGDPDLSGSWKQSNPSRVLNPGDLVTTTLHIENSGDIGTHVHVTETVPPCLDLGGGPTQWDFYLPAGDVETITYVGTAQGGACFDSRVDLVSDISAMYLPPMQLISTVHFGAATGVYLPLIVRAHTPPCDPSEPNDTFAQAVTMTVGVPMQQVFSEDADVDYLVFDIAQAGSYIVRTSNLAQDTDTILYLYDQTQTLLDWNDDAGPGQLWSEIGPLHLAAGRYYLKVEDYNPRSYGCDHTYDVVVQQ